MKNRKIRYAMLEAKMTQAELGKLLGVKQPIMSIVLNKFDLAKKEQDAIVKIIHEAREVK